MRDWQVVLEEFALHADPQGVELPGLRARISQAAKAQAIEYLVEKGFLAIAGFRAAEESEFIYEITAVGRLVYQAGWCRLNRRRPPGGWRTEKPETLSMAKKLAAQNPRTVWELAEKPWVWVKKLEHDYFTDKELAAKGIRRVHPKIKRQR